MTSHLQDTPLSVYQVADPGRGAVCRAPAGCQLVHLAVLPQDADGVGRDRPLARREPGREAARRDGLARDGVGGAPIVVLHDVDVVARLAAALRGIEGRDARRRRDLAGDAVGARRRVATLRGLTRRGHVSARGRQGDGRDARGVGLPEREREGQVERASLARQVDDAVGQGVPTELALERLDGLAALEVGDGGVQRDPHGLARQVHQARVHVARRRALGLTLLALGRDEGGRQVDDDGRGDGRRQRRGGRRGDGRRRGRGRGGGRGGRHGVRVMLGEGTGDERGHGRAVHGVASEVLTLLVSVATR